MGRVNLRFFSERKSPWRAQWSERVVDAEGSRLATRSSWFKDEVDALKFKAAHEGEAQRFEEIAMSSSDRARWWRLREDAAAAGVSIEVALAAGVAALKNAVPHSEPIETAFGLWLLDARDRKLRSHSIDSMRRSVRPFMTGRDSTPVEAFTGRDLLNWVAARYPDSQESRDDVLSRLLTFFRWCAAEPRVWCRADVFKGVKFEHKVIGEKKRIGFYTASEARAYLEAVPDAFKPAMATAFFLGVRPIELQRVLLKDQADGEFYGFDVKRGEWHIAPEWAKTRAYRKLYDVPDCWWYWWIKYQDAIGGSVNYRAKAKKPLVKLVPANYRNFRRVLKAARKAAGLRKNPKDGIRHSFGTHGYHRSVDGRARGLEWCLDLMGHESGLALFKKRYQGKVSPHEAEEYFAVYPAGAASEVKGRRRVIAS